MSAEDLGKYESEMELSLYREYRDVVGLFSRVVETERRSTCATASTCWSAATAVRSISTSP